ncbi:MAG: ribosome silencing factor [bacterium]|jgi:ribosome-associated protein
MRIVAEAAKDKLAIGLRILDVSEVTDFTEYVVLCQGQTPLQNRAIADRIIEALKEYDIILSSLSGYRAADWILVDYDSFVVHVFLPELHEFYRLDELYSGGRELLLD